MMSVIHHSSHLAFFQYFRCFQIVLIQGKSRFRILTGTFFVAKPLESFRTVSISLI